MICQECSYLAPENADVCPNCGHDLAGTSGFDSEPFRAQAPAPESNKRPWLIGAVVGALVLVIGGLSFALTKDQATGAVFRDRMPADVISYVEIDIAQLLSDDSKVLIEQFGGVVEAATGEEFDVDTIVQDMIDSLDAELGTDLSYQDDLASWASGSIAIGILAEDDLLNPSFVVWVSGKDETALSDFLGKVDGLAGAEGIELSRVTVGGVDFYATPTYFGQGPGAMVGQVGQDLLIVSSEAMAATVLELTPEESLLNAEGFSERIAGIPDEAIVIFASNGALGADLLGSAALGVAPLPADSPSLGWMVGAISVEDGNVRFDSVTGIDPDSSFVMSEDSPALAEMPAESIVFARLNGVADGLGTLAYSLGPEVDDEVEAMTGVTLDSILALFEVDAALAIWPSSEPEIPVGAAVVGVGGGDASPVVTQINELLFSEGGLNATSVPGGYWYENLVAFGARGPFMLITTDRSLLAGSPAAPLTSGSVYQKALDLIGSGYVPVFGADVDGVVDLIDGFINESEVLDGLACNPVRFIAAGYQSDGEVARVVAVIEIEAPDGCG